MNYGPAKLNTRLANQAALSRVQYAMNVVFDPEGEHRIKEGWCAPCWYAQVIAGAAMTTQMCALCDHKTMYGSTRTDVLCLPCAEKHNLCKHCGADLSIVSITTTSQRHTHVQAQVSKTEANLLRSTSQE